MPDVGEPVHQPHVPFHPLAHNPTRNRPLDMVPVLAHLDRERVAHRVEERRLVKPRPAFHYRLPNCMVDELDWTIAREWNSWPDVLEGYMAEAQS